MADWTTQRSGDWSAVSSEEQSPWYDGVGGTQFLRDSIPIDSDNVTIAAPAQATGHHVKFDVDQSGPDWPNGLGNLVIQGHATAPAMLYCDPYSDRINTLKIATGKTISGTAGTLKGRILANGDGDWASSVPLPLGSGSYRAFLIDLKGTAQITGANLELRLFGTEPTILSARTYGALKTIESVDTGTDRLTITAHDYTDGTALRVRLVGEGALPGGLEEDYTYYVRGKTTNDFKLAETNSDLTIVDITSAGSGTLQVYNGGGAGATWYVLDDVTGDPAWSTASERNFVVAANERAGTYQQLRTTLSTINADSLVLGASQVAMNPGSRIWNVTRNVAIRSNGTTTGQAIVNGGSNHKLYCEISNTAGTAVSNTTFYGYGVNNAATYETGGAMWGLERGISLGTATVYGVIAGCSSGCTYGTHALYGIIAGCSTGVNSNTATTIVGSIVGCTNGFAGNNRCCAVYGTIAGCNSGMTAENGFGQAFYGTIKSCATGISASAGFRVYGTIRGCTSGISGGVVELFYPAVLRANTQDLNGVAHCTGYGASLRSAVQNVSYLQTVPNDWRTNVIYDIANGAGLPQRGQLRAWTPGGTVVSEAAPGTPPVTLAYAHKMTGEVSTRDVFVDFPIFVRAGVPLDVLVYEKCNSLPSTFTVGPRFQIIDPAGPYNDAGTILVDKTALVDGGDDTDWHTILLSLTPTEDRPLLLRCRMRDATRFLHWAFRIAPPALPAVGDVDASAATYGYTSAPQTPTCLLPVVGDVKQGVQYGAGGTEFTGELLAEGVARPRRYSRFGV